MGAGAQTKLTPMQSWKQRSRASVDGKPGGHTTDKPQKGHQKERQGSGLGQQHGALQAGLGPGELSALGMHTAVVSEPRAWGRELCRQNWAHAPSGECEGWAHGAWGMGDTAADLVTPPSTPVRKEDRKCPYLPSRQQHLCPSCQGSPETWDIHVHAMRQQAGRACGWGAEDPGQVQA